MRARKSDRFFDKLSTLNQQTVISWQRLQDHGGNLAAMLSKNSSYCVLVVQWRNQGFVGNIRRNAGARTRRSARQTAARFCQQRIGMAVIATFELKDFISFGCCPRYPQRAHRRFGSGRNKAQNLDPRAAQRNPSPEPDRLGL